MIRAPGLSKRWTDWRTAQVSRALIVPVGKDESSQEGDQATSRAELCRHSEVWTYLKGNEGPLRFGS